MDDLRLSQEVAVKAFQDLDEMDFCYRCARTGWVLLPKYLKYNPIESPNQAKAALKLIDRVPRQAAFIPALQASMQRYGDRHAEVLLSSPSSPRPWSVSPACLNRKAERAASRMSRAPSSADAQQSSRMSPSHSTAGDQGLMGESERVSAQTIQEDEGENTADHERVPKGFRNPSPKPFRNQEQEQEQEQEKERAGVPPPIATRSRSERAPIGTRLTLSALPDDWRQWAITERPDLDADKTWDLFADYWRAKPGKDGRKSDWLATWRNWVRREKPATGPGKTARPTLADRNRSAMEEWLSGSATTTAGNVFDGEFCREA
ncbi:MAG: hypothetical protein MZV65_31940 [Chromatiales bacterium]|nr:hypothetical protein [Chromatiales bacterium]